MASAAGNSSGLSLLRALTQTRPTVFTAPPPAAAAAPAPPPGPSLWELDEPARVGYSAGGE